MFNISMFHYANGLWLYCCRFIIGSCVTSGNVPTALSNTTRSLIKTPVAVGYFAPKSRINRSNAFSAWALVSAIHISSNLRFGFAVDGFRQFIEHIGGLAYPSNVDNGFESRLHSRPPKSPRHRRLWPISARPLGSRRSNRAGVRAKTPWILLRSSAGHDNRLTGLTSVSRLVH